MFTNNPPNVQLIPPTALTAVAIDCLSTCVTYLCGGINNDGIQTARFSAAPARAGVCVSSKIVLSYFNLTHPQMLKQFRIYTNNLTIFREVCYKICELLRFDKINRNIYSALQIFPENKLDMCSRVVEK